MSQQFRCFLGFVGGGSVVKVNCVSCTHITDVPPQHYTSETQQGLRRTGSDSVNKRHAVYDSSSSSRVQQLGVANVVIQRMAEETSDSGALTAFCEENEDEVGEEQDDVGAASKAVAKNGS